MTTAAPIQQHNWPPPEQPARYRRRPQYPREQLTAIRFNGHNHAALAKFAGGDLRFLQPPPQQSDATDTNQAKRQTTQALLPGKSMLQDIKVGQFLAKSVIAALSDAVGAAPPVHYEINYFVMTAEYHRLCSQDPGSDPDEPHAVYEPKPANPTMPETSVLNHDMTVEAVQYTGNNYPQLTRLAGDRVSQQEFWNPARNSTENLPVLAYNYTNGKIVQVGDWLVKFEGYPGEAPRPTVYDLESSAAFYAGHEPAPQTAT